MIEAKVGDFWRIVDRIAIASTGVTKSDDTDLRADGSTFTHLLPLLLDNSPYYELRARVSAYSSLATAGSAAVGISAFLTWW